jgi:hypothetical protein
MMMACMERQWCSCNSARSIQGGRQVTLSGSEGLVPTLQLHLLASCQSGLQPQRTPPPPALVAAPGCQAPRLPSLLSWTAQLWQSGTMLHQWAAVLHVN